MSDLRFFDKFLFFEHQKKVMLKSRVLILLLLCGLAYPALPRKERPALLKKERTTPPPEVVKAMLQSYAEEVLGREVMSTTPLSEVKGLIDEFSQLTATCFIQGRGCPREFLQFLQERLPAEPTQPPNDRTPAEKADPELRNIGDTHAIPDPSPNCPQGEPCPPLLTSSSNERKPPSTDEEKKLEFQLKLLKRLAEQSTSSTYHNRTRACAKSVFLRCRHLALFLSAPSLCSTERLQAIMWTCLAFVGLAVLVTVYASIFWTISPDPEILAEVQGGTRRSDAVNYFHEYISHHRNVQIPRRIRVAVSFLMVMSFVWFYFFMGHFPAVLSALWPSEAPRHTTTTKGDGWLGSLCQYGLQFASSMGVPFVGALSSGPIISLYLLGFSALYPFGWWARSLLAAVKELFKRDQLGKMADDARRTRPRPEEDSGSEEE